MIRINFPQMIISGLGIFFLLNALSLTPWSSEWWSFIVGIGLITTKWENK